MVRTVPGFENRGLPAILRAAVSASVGHGVRRYCSVRVRAGHLGLLGKPGEARLSLAVGNTHSLGDPTHRCRGMRAHVGKDPLITPEAALELVFHEEAGGAHAETERGRQGSPIISAQLGSDGVQEANDRECGARCPIFGSGHHTSGRPSENSQDNA